MPITLLRWKSGAAGDTVLKLVLESNPNLLSQVAYTKNSNHNRSTVDIKYIENFKYKEIALMSTSYNKVNETVLLNELHQLNSDNGNCQWLLKTHSYINFPYPTIDIVVDQQVLPFAVTACLKKNFQNENINLNPWYDTNYNKIVKIIQDPDILYKYNCYNLAIDRISTENSNPKQIKLIDILSGWDMFLNSIKHVQLNVSDRFKNYYNAWLEENNIFFPSKEYIELIKTEKYDYTCANLSLEERYCLLALAGKKFKIL